jgi:hypothetical protein
VTRSDVVAGGAGGALCGSQAVSERPLDLRTGLTAGVLFSIRGIVTAGTICEIGVKVS